MLSDRFSQFRRQIEQKVGGPQKTRALIEIGQFLVFLPIVLVMLLFGYGRTEHHVLDAPVSATSLLIPALFSALLVRPFDYYVSMASTKHFGPRSSAQISYKATVIFAFLWAYYWNHPFTAQVSGIYGRAEVVRQEHPFHFITLLVAIGYYLTAGVEGEDKSSRASLVGYSSNGNPLYSVHDSSSALNSSAALIKSFLTQVLANEERIQKLLEKIGKNYWKSCLNEKQKKIQGGCLPL